RLLKSSLDFLSYEVERISRKANTGAHAYIEIKNLAHRYDGAEVAEAFSTQFRLQLGFGCFLRLGRDRAEQPQFVLAKEFHRTLGECVPFVTPGFPSDLGMNILGLEPDCVQDSNCLRQHLVSNTIAGHRHYCVFRHI